MKNLDCLSFEGEERVGGQDAKEKTGRDVDYFS